MRRLDWIDWISGRGISSAVVCGVRSGFEFGFELSDSISVPVWLEIASSTKCAFSCFPIFAYIWKYIIIRVYSWILDEIWGYRGATLCKINYHLMGSLSCFNFQKCFLTLVLSILTCTECFTLCPRRAWLHSLVCILQLQFLTFFVLKTELEGKRKKKGVMLLISRVRLLINVNLTLRL